MWAMMEKFLILERSVICERALAERVGAVIGCESCFKLTSSGAKEDGRRKVRWGHERIADNRREACGQGRELPPV
jgi:hypothetical protein